MVTLKLDWDDITFKTAASRMGRLYDGLGVVPDLYKTPHGYHCYCKLTDRINPDNLLAMRLLYWDDPCRVRLDRERIEAGTGWDVLFQDDEWRVPLERVAKALKRASFVG